MAVNKKGGGKAPAKAGGAGGAKKGTGLTQDSLKASAAAWKSTPTPEPNSFGDIPDGKYQAKVEEAIIENGGKNRDRLQVKWSFRITGPTHANRLSWMNTGLGDEQGIEFTKRALATLGMSIPEEIEQLPEILGKAVGMAVEINLRTKTNDNGTFQNTYLNKALNADDTAAAAEATGATTETVSLVGKLVEFDVDDKTKAKGKVTSQTGETVTVTVEKDGDYEMTVADVSIVEEKAPAEPEKPKTDPAMVGKTVKFKDDAGKDLTGKVVGTDGEGNLNVQVGDEEWGVPESECTVVEAAGPRKVTKKK